MKKNEIFTFTAPNGVEVTAVVIASVGFAVHIRTAERTYLCYSQNKLFTYIEKKDIYTDEVVMEYGEVIVDYCVIPKYDAMLKTEQQRFDDECYEALSSIGDVDF